MNKALLLLIFPFVFGSFTSLKPASANAGLGIYLQIPEILGASIQVDHVGWIGIQSISFGAAAPRIVNNATSSLGRAYPNTINFTAQILDKSLTGLLKNCLVGELFATGTKLHITKDSGVHGPQNIEETEFKDVFISDVTIHGSDATTGTVNVQFSITYGAIFRKFKEYSMTNVMSETEMKWNYLTNMSEF